MLLAVRKRLRSAYEAVVGREKSPRSRGKKRSRPESNEDDEYEAYGKRSVVVWEKDRGRVARQRGKLLQSMGRTEAGATWLWAEETLYLAERGQSATLVDAAKKDDETSIRDLYALVLAQPGLPCLPCYWVYAHLRGLGYVVDRCAKRPPSDNHPRLWTPETSGLDAVSYEVFQPQPNFSKATPGTPAFYVVITIYTGLVPPIPTLAALLRLAAPVPVKIAVVSSDGSVLLFDLDLGVKRLS